MQCPETKYNVFFTSTGFNSLNNELNFLYTNAKFVEKILHILSHLVTGVLQLEELVSLFNLNNHYKINELVAKISWNFLTFTRVSVVVKHA